jgi:hypothetical protein
MLVLGVLAGDLLLLLLVDGDAVLAPNRGDHGVGRSHLLLHCCG